MVQSLFLAEDIETIQSIPLCPRPMEDTLIWPFTESGCYTVKSGYRFLFQDQEISASIVQAEDQETWKRIWGTVVQNKVRNFLWRAVKNSIPSKSNLVHRRVLGEDICDHCKAGSEDVIHALWLCPHLDLVWNSNPSWNFQSLKQFQNCKELVQHVIKEGKDPDFLATTVWTIWYRRNAIRASNKSHLINQVIPAVLPTQASFLRAIPPKPPDPTIRVPSSFRWNPPQYSHLKVNFDGAVFLGRECSRDRSGDLG